jgi:hypothetical protein
MLCCFCCSFCLTLTLFVAWVFTDNHYVAVATNDLALVTDRLDAWLHLHDGYLFGCGRLLTYNGK